MVQDTFIQVTPANVYIDVQNILETKEGMLFCHLNGVITSYSIHYTKLYESFVWEEFQNGANDSNAKIIVAMFVIGFIGFGLDRLMMVIQKFASFDSK